MPHNECTAIGSCAQQNAHKRNIKLKVVSSEEKKALSFHLSLVLNLLFRFHVGLQPSMTFTISFQIYLFFKKGCFSNV